MAITWTVKGEAGKAMDATARSFDTIGATNPKLTDKLGMGIDMLRWTVDLADTTGTSAIIPEKGQKVSLLRQVDSGTPVTVFHGTVGKRKSVMDDKTLRVEIEVVGPGWWLQRILVSGESEDESENSFERAVYRLAEDDLGDMLTTLITAAATAGAPVDVGTIPAIYDVPQQTFTKSSFLSALGNLVLLCPDLLCWWDYSADPAEFNCIRRGDADVLALDFSSGDIAKLDLEDAADLEVGGVVLGYSERLPNGAQAYAELNTEKTRASLTIDQAGANNAITITARKPGAAGNSLRFRRFVDTFSEVIWTDTTDIMLRAPSGTTASTLVDLVNNCPPQNAFVRVGTTNQYQVTAKAKGSAGNGVQFQTVTSGTGSRVLSITTTSTKVTATLGSNTTMETLIRTVNGDGGASALLSLAFVRGSVSATAGGAATNTCADGNGGAASVVSAALVAGETGSGTIPSSTSYTNLAGGSDGASIATGKRQLITTSGPDLESAPIYDPSEVALIQTASATAFNLLLEGDQKIQPIADEYGPFTLSEYTTTIGTNVVYQGTVPATRSIYGGPTSLSYYITSPVIPEWIYELDGVAIGDIRRSGSWYYRVNPYSTYAALSNFEKALFDAADVSKVIVGGAYAGLWMFFELSGDAKGISEEYAQLTTIRRPGSFSYVGVPDDFADNLKAAQNWLPYVGSITLEDQECDPEAVRSKVVNVANGFESDWATMQAIPSSVEHEILYGRSVLRLGSPQRASLQNIVNRIGTSPQDNVIDL